MVQNPEQRGRTAGAIVMAGGIATGLLGVLGPKEIGPLPKTAVEYLGILILVGGLYLYTHPTLPRFPRRRN